MIEHILLSYGRKYTDDGKFEKARVLNLKNKIVTE